VVGDLMMEVRAPRVALTDLATLIAPGPLVDPLAEAEDRDAVGVRAKGELDQLKVVIDAGLKAWAADGALGDVILRELDLGLHQDAVAQLAQLRQVALDLEPLAALHPALQSLGVALQERQEVIA